jgi:hypothetical protein
MYDVILCMFLSGVETQAPVETRVVEQKAISPHEVKLSGGLLSFMCLSHTLHSLSSMHTGSDTSSCHGEQRGSQRLPETGEASCSAVFDLAAHTTPLQGVSLRLLEALLALLEAKGKGNCTSTQVGWVFLSS